MAAAQVFEPGSWLVYRCRPACYDWANTERGVCFFHFHTVYELFFTLFCCKLSLDDCSNGYNSVNSQNRTLKKPFAVKKSWFLFLFSLSCMCIQPGEGRAQAYISWEHFLNDFFEEQMENGMTDDDYELWKERLTSLHENPVNLNRCRRDELLRLPFLNESQVDSILSYRERKRHFVSLGELLYIHNLGRRERQYVSLFVFCGDTVRRKITFREMIARGQYDVMTQLNIPLYKVAGNKHYTQEELADNPNKTYLGNGLAHKLRYAYKYGSWLRYGVAFEKDAGEPFGSYGTYPYDFSSFYFHYQRPDGSWQVLAGDFRVTFGQGLLVGTGVFGGKLSVLTARRLARSSFRPHTSAGETDFFRGAAAAVRLKQRWSLMGFVSRRRLDAVTSGDTVTSFKTDGLHRTLRETSRHGNLGAWAAGTHLAYTADEWNAGVGGFFFHYDKTVYPRPRAYNRHYFRGQNGGGLSASYAFKRGGWNAYGEIAVDGGFHLASTHTVSYDLDDKYAFSLQGRSFSPRFASPYGHTLQEASRVGNEHALLLGATVRSIPGVELTGYADLCYFPTTTYTATGPSKAMELFLRATYRRSEHLYFMTQYKWKTKQRDVTGYDGVMQYASTHRMKLRAGYESGRLAMQASADAAVAASQTEAASFGWMFSTRAAVNLRQRVSISAFGALFFTDGYATRLYAYEPQLRFGSGFPTFAHHGFRLAAVVTCKLPWHLTAGAKWGVTHYFNRSTISSGTQAIASPTKSDAALFLRFKLR